MKIANIIANDVVNGEDVCVSLFVQGCNRHCPGCFNSDTWDFNGGKEIDIPLICDQIINLLQYNGIQRNFSILGGEPLNEQNRHDIATIISKVRNIYPNIQIWVWTGYTIEELDKIDSDITYILNNINVLVDGPYVAEERDLSLPYRGSRNQRVLRMNGV